mgnify:FL=1
MLFPCFLVKGRGRDQFADHHFCNIFLFVCTSIPLFGVHYSTTSSSPSHNILPFVPPSSCSSLCFVRIIYHCNLLVWLLSLIIKLSIAFLYPKICVFVSSLVCLVVLWQEGSNSGVMKHLSSSRCSHFRVCVHVPFPCAFGRLVMKEQFERAEASHLLIKAYGHSTMCALPFLVRSPTFHSSI